MKRTLILDAGHGGLDPAGRYTTAPAKMHEFEGGATAYEGVINRQFLDAVYRECKEQGSKCMEISHEYIDIPLSYRVRAGKALVEWLHDPVFVSLHNNASPNHNATGTEIFTTRGNTHSDPFATAIMEEAVKLMPALKIRSDYHRDGDIDKEADFYIIKHMDKYCPSVLIEFDFFDTLEGYELITDKEYQKKWAQAIVNAL